MAHLFRVQARRGLAGKPRSIMAVHGASRYGSLGIGKARKGRFGCGRRGGARRKHGEDGPVLT